MQGVVVYTVEEIVKGITNTAQHLSDALNGQLLGESFSEILIDSVFYLWLSTSNLFRT